MNYQTYNGSGTWDILANPDFPYDHYVHKTLTYLPCQGRIHGWGYWGNGMVNRVGLANRGLEHFEEKIVPQIPIDFIASIYGTHELEWVFLTEGLDAINSVKAIEVNLSCPNVNDQHLASIGIQKVMKVVASKTDKPIYAKLGPHHSIYSALACQNNGASKVVLCNSLPTPRGGLSGPPIKSLVLDLISDLANTETFTIPVIGMGGINGLDDEESISEYLAAGATDIGIGCANLQRSDNSA